MARRRQRKAWWIPIGLIALAGAEQPRLHAQGPTGAPPGARAALSASFVSNDSAGLRRLLDPQLIIQPPFPDTAKTGAAAVEYLLGLAAATSVSDSRLEPQASVAEGLFGA